jgi:integrase
MSEKREQKSVWERTSVQCLYRHGKSGIYYARASDGKRKIWRTLKTKSLSVARLRLADHLKEIRRVRESNQAVESGEVTMRDVVAVYQERFESNTHLVESTKHVRRTALGRLLKTWPGIEKLHPRQVTTARIHDWAARLKKHGTGFSPPGSRCPPKRKKGISASSVNQTVATLKRLMKIAMEKGAIYSNPTDAEPPEGMERLRAKETNKKIRLPSKKEFSQLFKVIESSGSGWAPYAADLSRFLAYSGTRVGEARRMTWRHIDFGKGQLYIPGTKSETSDRVVPMLKPMRELLNRLYTEANEPKHDNRILRVGECQKSLDRACELLGIERITHHDLRHLFATVCIESGVDIPTVSRWLGHKDGGALAMRIYGHLRDDHSKYAAERVNFDDDEPAV